MRPRTLDEFVGQSHIIGPGRPLRQAIDARHAALADPLGTAGHRQDDAGAAARVGDRRRLRRVQRGDLGHQGDQGRSSPRPSRCARSSGRRTLLFVDEIHRFNKAQQDAFLPHVEARHHHPRRRDDGEPVVRGELGAALARRRSTSCARSTIDDIVTILRRALTDTERGLGDCACRGRRRRAHGDCDATPTATRAWR